MPSQATSSGPTIGSMSTRPRRARSLGIVTSADAASGSDAFSIAATIC
jgi:hypothetical protein